MATLAAPGSPPVPASTGRAGGRVAFLARSLGFGGAERQLVTLARGLHRRGRDVVVVVFYGGGELEAELRDAGVRLRVIGKRGRWDVGGFLARAVRVLREERPAVVHPYLDIPNVLAALLRPFLPPHRLVWGVRASDLELDRYDWLVRAGAAALRRLARVPDLVIVNSRVGLDHHRAAGFSTGRMRVVPNGIDTERFRPDAERRRRLRSEWRVGEDELLVGLVGRLDPMKDHPTFLRAAAELAALEPRLRFVCVGDGPAEYGSMLRSLARELGLGLRIAWHPARPDAEAIYPALDVLCSSSAFGEGFSNVIAEAMACGVPVVATEVGDARTIVGDTGLVVPPADPPALAAALRRLLADARLEERRSAARQRVVDHFSVEKLLDRTEEVLWGSA